VLCNSQNKNSLLSKTKLTVFLWGSHCMFRYYLDEFCGFETVRYMAFKIVGMCVIVVSFIWYACYSCQYYMIWVLLLSIHDMSVIVVNIMWVLLLSILYDMSVIVVNIWYECYCFQYYMSVIVVSIMWYECYCCQYDMSVIVVNIIWYELLRQKFFTIVCHKYGYGVQLFSSSVTLFSKFQLLPRTEGMFKWFDNRAAHRGRYWTVNP